jgi:hypothetical protein
MNVIKDILGELITWISLIYEVDIIENDRCNKD